MPKAQSAQYDAVLGLTDRLNKGTLAALLASMDTHGIRYAVMHAETEGGEDADDLNDRLLAVIGEYPGRFVGVGTVDPSLPTPSAVMQQARRVRERGLAGISLQCAFFGLDIDDRRLYPTYALAEETGLIVAVHTGVTYSHMHPMRHERAEMLDQVACDFPGLRLVASDGGWPQATEYAAVALRHPTIYLEFGGVAPKYVMRPGTGWDAVASLMPRLSDQLLFATDWPVLLHDRALREWEEASLRESVIERFLSANTRALLGAPGQ